MSRPRPVPIDPDLDALPRVRELLEELGLQLQKIRVLADLLADGEHDENDSALLAECLLDVLTRAQGVQDQALRTVVIPAANVARRADGLPVIQAEPVQ
jgi:8-oxo-dGTP pyrophosphatase MutT (NUDIX family)